MVYGSLVDWNMSSGRNQWHDVPDDIGSLVDWNMSSGRNQQLK